MILAMMGFVLATPDCVAIGDSLALGVASAINARVRGTSCRIDARKGVPASLVRRSLSPVSADVAIVSAGANDAASPTLTEDLREIRRRVSARQVIWIIPTDARAATAARRVCREYADVGVALSRFRRPDGVHPADYDAVTRHAFQITTCE